MNGREQRERRLGPSTIKIGAFDSPRQAEQAIEELWRGDFSKDQIGFVILRGEETEVVAARAGGRADQAATVGAVAGGVLGSALGGLAAVSIPGAGPLLAADLLAGILGGGASGAVGGGLLGALVGLGIPEKEARYYERVFQDGDALVIVRATSRSAEASAILSRNGAQDMETRSTP